LEAEGAVRTGVHVGITFVDELRSEFDAVLWPVARSNLGI